MLPSLAMSVSSPRPRTSVQVIRAAARVWHKSFRYGTNRAKRLEGAAHASAITCPHCPALESPSHIFSRCQAPGLPQLREKIYDDAHRRLLQALGHPSVPYWERCFFRHYLELAFRPPPTFPGGPDMAWNATIGQPEMIFCLARPSGSAQRSLTMRQFQDFKKRFSFIVTPLPQLLLPWKILNSALDSGHPPRPSPRPSGDVYPLLQKQL